MERNNFSPREGSYAGKTGSAKAQKAGQPCLRVIKVNDYFVFPWIHFLYAKGQYEEITALFSSHKIIFKGEGLYTLLNSIAEHRHLLVKEGDRMSRFEDKLLGTDEQADFIVSKVLIEPRDKEDSRYPFEKF